MRHAILVILFSLFTLSACNSDKSKMSDKTEAMQKPVSAPEKNMPKEIPVAPVKEAIEVGVDYHSLSNPNEVILKHIDLDLNVDFDKKIIS